MRRRDLLGTLFNAMLAVDPGLAQQRKVPTIGVLVVGVPGSDEFLELFPELMRELGYVEGQSVHYVVRSDDGQGSRLPALADELVGLRVDVIVTWFTPAALAAKAATHDIPIVMALAGSAVENGLVASLDRPGGNVTGITSIAAQLGGKCVELLREVLPAARRVVALANAPDPFSGPFLEQIRFFAAHTGTQLDAKMLSGAEELGAAFVAMEADRPDAIVVQPSLPLRRVAELAIRHRIPSACPLRAFAREGGLMSYAAQSAPMMTTRSPWEGR